MLRRFMFLHYCEETSLDLLFHVNMCINDIFLIDECESKFTQEGAIRQYGCEIGISPPGKWNLLIPVLLALHA